MDESYLDKVSEKLNFYFKGKQVDDIASLDMLGMMKDGINEIKEKLEVTPEIQYIIDFVESSQRGIIR